MTETLPDVSRWRDGLASDESEADAADAATRRWIDSVVIGKNLCPFARHVRGSYSHMVPTALAPDETDELLGLVGAELQALAASDRRLPATSLVLLTHEGFSDFEIYMQAIALPAQELADELVGSSVQVVLFHPHAHWGDADVADPADYSTRSPLPMLHLLRDSDVVAAEIDWVRQHGGAEADAPDIQQTNAALLRGMGLQAAREMWERAVSGKCPLPHPDS
jgi:hypothetical protein